MEGKEYRWVAGILFIGLSIYIFYSTLSQAFAFSSYRTGITKNWANAFEWIKNNTPKCSLIATYWDPGFWIQDLAERPVVFDGGSQNSLKRTKLENLHGLDCIRDRKGLVDEERGLCITARIRDISTCLYTENETLCAKILLSYLPEKDNSLYRRYYGNCTPKIYFLASSDLLGKSHWWSMFATWDVEKKGGNPSDYYIVGLQKREKLILEKGYALYYHPFVFYPTQKIYIPVLKIVEKGNNSQEITPYLYDGGNFYKIKKLAFYSDNSPIIYEYEDAEMEGMLYLGNNLQFVIFIPKELENSLFTRMFLFNGYGLKYFKLVYSNPEVKLFELRYED